MNSPFDPEMMAALRTSVALERRERIATAVYAAMRPGVRESTHPRSTDTAPNDYPALAREAVAAAAALIAALDGKAIP